MAGNGHRRQARPVVAAMITQQWQMIIIGRVGHTGRHHRGQVAEVSALCALDFSFGSPFQSIGTS